MLDYTVVFTPHYIAHDDCSTLDLKCLNDPILNDS